MSKHVKRFYAAVSALAGHGHIKQRLVEAYEGSLSVIEEDELPVGMRQSFADLKTEMNNVDPLNGEGPIRASVRKMSVEQADECAQRVVDLYREIMLYDENSQETLPLRIDDQPLLPPFLVKSS